MAVDAVEHLSAGEDNTIEWRLTEACARGGEARKGARFITLDMSYIDLSTPKLDRVASFNPGGSSGGYLETGALTLLLRPPLEVRAWLYRDTVRRGDIGHVLRVLNAADAPVLSLAEAWSPTDSTSGAVIRFASGREWGRYATMRVRASVSLCC
jgi:hypothetical protein